MKFKKYQVWENYEGNIFTIINIEREAAGLYDIFGVVTKFEKDGLCENDFEFITVDFREGTDQIYFSKLLSEPITA